VADPVKHGRKFGAAYFALAAVLGAAIGTFILLVERPAPPPPPAWSIWKPTATSAIERANEIATFVGAQYHLKSGHQLVHVDVGSPTAGNDPIRFFAIAKKPTVTSRSDVDVVDATSTLMFNLCGAGKKCSIKEGKPSVARGAVLRREALELALYTFRYVDGVDAVVAFLPPKPNSPSYAVFFKKDDLDSELDHPLGRTLPQRKPPLPGKLTPAERRTVDALTLTRYFRFELQRANNGARVLVLRPAAV
jgi:hypothetical protein